MIAMEINADTRRIADTLAATRVGETITLDHLTREIRRDIRRNRHIIYGAMRVVEREVGAVFACERGIGYRRLKANELALIGQTARARIRRTARRGAKTIAAGSVFANDLSNQERRKILAEQSSLGVLEHLARDKSLPDVAPTETRPLSIVATAQAFLAAIGAKSAGEDAAG